MAVNRDRELHKQIEKYLTRKIFLKRIGMTKKSMLDLLKSQNWRMNASVLNSEDKLTCGKILEISRSTLDCLCQEPARGWLKYCYDETLLFLFPDSEVEPGDERYEAGRLFLCETIRAVHNFRKNKRELSPINDFGLLTREEALKERTGEEYLRFIKTDRQEYIFEFMKIGAEITPFNTFGHVAGVHFVAMHIARQMKTLGIPIDLALVSAAAATHDIGKFGCKKNEAKRVAHLHYYYTDECLQKLKLPAVAHIASNHSTWDLELEDLSAESLVLIYSDFRVKSNRNQKGVEIVRFYSLKEAFDVILSKLENVDKAKEMRYTRVYEKLHDFEEYIRSIGVNPELCVSDIVPGVWRPASLLSGLEVTDRIKYLAINHNIEVMNRFGNETEFANMLEEARSERNWKNVRSYINTIAEYYEYMSQNQKQMSIGFLKELSIHREGDIRRMAAGLVGSIIAGYEEDFRKELPANARMLRNSVSSHDLWKDYIKYIIYPDLTSTEQQKRWMGYSFKAAFDHLMTECGDAGEKKKYFDEFMNILDDDWFNDAAIFIILDTLLDIPVSLCEEKDLIKIAEFCDKAALSDRLETRVAVLRVLRFMVENFPVVMTDQLKSDIRSLTSLNTDEKRVCVVYLKWKIFKGLEFSEQANLYENMLMSLEEEVSDIFRDNLKVGTPWNIKVVNIELLLEQLERQQNGSHKIVEAFYVATHLSNLLKVSERVTVRHAAGRGLVRIVDLLSWDRRNELAVELTKGLEIGEYQFSKYIPDYLGVIVMSLHPDELDEIITNFGELMETGNEKVASVTLDTLGVMINNFRGYKSRFNIYAGDDSKRKDRILGMIMKGMSDYHEAISEEAFMVIGQSIFGSTTLSLEEKADIYMRINKKMVTLIEDNKSETLRFFNNASSLNHMYRFISDYQFYKGALSIKENNRVAFFPGTFDPFSLGHKGIVSSIRNMGFEVYLALDEFSWSKKTQPRMFRKKIMTMSCADETDVYIFPDDIPVNIANPEDISRLKEIFSRKELYLVVGSDVIANASSYRTQAAENSVQSLNHIVFKRESMEQGDETDLAYRDHAETISGHIVELTLPTHLEDISSTRIRDNIDAGNDISNLIDPVAQSYIYDNALYLREPQYKGTLDATDMRFHTVKENNRIKTIQLFYGKGGEALSAEASVHLVKATDLFSEFGDENLSGYIREKGLGKILVLDYVRLGKKLMGEEVCQLLMTETLSEALRYDYTYAVYTMKPELKEDRFTREILRRQGFKEIVIDGRQTGCMAIDMRNPVLITGNMETVLKNPFNKNQRVAEVIARAHVKLQEALVKVYPDTLILSVNSSVMNYRLMEKVTAENGVPSVPRKKRQLGPAMCVPFGKILTGMAVPNTVTKTLHTEKCFYSNLQDFEITEAPYYSSLDNQVKVIKSFMRPVILVDDVLHKGFRVKILDAIMNENLIRVQKLIVGILSGRGKDLVTSQGRGVDSVYYIPNLKATFTETWMYPFIGGDGVYRKEGNEKGNHQYICMILPYAISNFMKDRPIADVYRFSLVCLENSRDILKTIEEEYQIEFKKKLTMERLSEALVSPKKPDAGECLNFDKTIAASEYLESDIERLQRLSSII